MNSYEIAARYYDAAYEVKKLADLPFYLEAGEWEMIFSNIILFIW